MSGVWMRLSNGREELIMHPDHVNRLLDEGGTIISDPRLSPTIEPAVIALIETVFDEPVEVEDIIPRRRRQSKS